MYVCFWLQADAKLSWDRLELLNFNWQINESWQQQETKHSPLTSLTLTALYIRFYTLRVTFCLTLMHMQNKRLKDEICGELYFFNFYFSKNCLFIRQNNKGFLCVGHVAAMGIVNTEMFQITT